MIKIRVLHSRVMEWIAKINSLKMLISSMVRY